jgi:hypothetical protein
VLTMQQAEILLPSPRQAESQDATAATQLLKLLLEAILIYNQYNKGLLLLREQDDLAHQSNPSPVQHPPVVQMRSHPCVHLQVDLGNNSLGYPQIKQQLLRLAKGHHLSVAGLLELDQPVGLVGHLYNSSQMYLHLALQEHLDLVK